MNRNYTDVGGLPAEPVKKDEHELAFWERRVEAMRDLLGKRAVPVLRVDELRRSMETMGEELYNTLAFYERKAWSLRDVLVEKKILDRAELDRHEKMVRARREQAIDELPEQYDHRHDHAHAKDDDVKPSEYDALSEAIYDCLVEKGVLTASDVRAMIERMEDAGPAKGARIVAHAWVDPGFKSRLLADGKSTLKELDIESLETQLFVVENTPNVHNVIVCTLCSCYPRSVLGSPPAWYVSKAYRSRTIKEPRAVLAEFGTAIPDNVEVRVHDSTADMRYMVLPMRPPGTDDMSEDALAGLVSRDSLIGVSGALSSSGDESHG